MKNKGSSGQEPASDLIGKALAHHQGGRLREAEALYREVLKTDASNFDALHLLGVIANQSGKGAQAVELIGRAIQRDPQHAYAHNNLGLALQGQNKLDEAAGSYRKALAIKPDFTDAYFNLGNVQQAQGKAEEAIASYSRALELQPQDAEVHNNLGSAYRALGRLDEAVASYRKATAISPGYAEACNNLGVALQEQGKMDEALDALHKATVLRPEYAEAYNNMGVAFLKDQKPGKAADSYRKSISLKPDYAEAHANLGNVLQRLGKFDEAIVEYRRALECKPDYAEAHGYLGAALGRQGKLAEAVESLHRALSLKPDLAHAYVGLAEVHMDQGKFDAAKEYLNRALEIEPGHPIAWASLAQMKKMSADDEAWLETASRLASNPVVPAEGKVALQYAIGKFHDDTRQYDLAFEAYRQANLLKRKMEGGFDRAGFSRLVDSLIAASSADRFGRDIPGASPSRLPVLIVGMPRSGTSLIEQIISSHPDAFGAGELMFWNEQVESNQAAVLSGDYEAGLVSGMAAEYERCLRTYSASAARILDKMPGNFLWLGIIHAVFPQARIIHATRNPVDTCLSVYFQNLMGAYAYGTDLGDLACYFREYKRMMNHWRELFPEGILLDAPYEGLLDNQPQWSRRIIEFIGLEWDERCLDFHHTERKVGTWSNWQVRQKIYHTSRERWRNYAGHVGPLLDLLDLE